MAKIRNSKPKNTSGGYMRLLGQEQLANLLVKSQSTVISNGNELEKMLTQRANCISNLDDFLAEVNYGKIYEGTFLCPKKVIKKSKYNLHNSEPDFIIFSITPSSRNCWIIELKDGDQFDTKKSFSEKNALKEFKSHFGSMVEFKTNYKICAFNQLDKEKIISGFKSYFLEEEVMTGKEFCDILGINYEEIINKRKEDAIDNLKYFTDEVAKVVEVQEKVNHNQKEIVKKEEFYEAEFED